LESIISADHALFKLINQSWSNGLFDQIFPFITDLHKTLYFKIIFLVLIFGFHFYKFSKKGIFTGLACLLCVGITDWTGNQFFKKPIDRQRPFEFVHLETIQRTNAQPGSSFISNHAANMFALATFSSFIVPATGIILVPFAALAAYSRVYNGVHFPLDVLGGATWGVLLGFMFSQIVMRYLIQRKSKALT